MSRLALLLRIDNVDNLPDGGPVTFTLDRRGIDIGRDPYLDWTLPDPERFISGKHCEIRYSDGGYWLHDVSTNGTSINGRDGRLTEPYRLQDGDRIYIGHYIVAVELEGKDTAPPSSSTPTAENVWDDVPDAAGAVDRRDFAAGARGPADLPEEEISWSIGELTQDASSPGEAWGTPTTERGNTQDDWGWTPPRASAPATTPQEETSPDEEAAPDPAATDANADPAPPSPGAPAPPEVRDPLDAEAPPPGDGGFPLETARGVEPTLIAAPSPETPAPVERPPPSPEPAEAATETGLAGQWVGGETPQPPAAAAERRPPSGGGGFVAAFERGAGMPTGAVATRSDEAFAEELGALFRLVTEKLQAMLLARAETKSAIRSSERTMINALENNPLKFSPTSEDAMRIMFGAKSRSYLDAGATLQSSFDDLQRHQIQTFAAMQQALHALIEDLDPKNIEGATSEESGLAALVTSRRAKFWDTYVERFRAKSARNERGMTDAFMVLFAEMYDRQR